MRLLLNYSNATGKTSAGSLAGRIRHTCKGCRGSWPAWESSGEAAVWGPEHDKMCCLHAQAEASGTLVQFVAPNGSAVTIGQVL